MRVLVMESSLGASEAAASALAKAGHEVLRCHDTPAAFPCKGVDGDCPLDEGVVDVALLVRDIPGGEPTAREAGVRCAIRRQVPVAVAAAGSDPSLGNPYQNYAALTTDLDPAAITAAIERAYRIGLMPVADAARASLRHLLDREGLDSCRADAWVEREGSTLTITLHPGVALESGLAETASVRALAAVRGLDPQVAIIDVAVESPAAAPA